MFNTWKGTAASTKHLIFIHFSEIKLPNLLPIPRLNVAFFIFALGITYQTLNQRVPIVCPAASPLFR